MQVSAFTKKRKMDVSLPLHITYKLYFPLYEPWWSYGESLKVFWFSSTARFFHRGKLCSNPGVMKKRKKKNYMGRSIKCEWISSNILASIIGTNHPIDKNKTTEDEDFDEKLKEVEAVFNCNTVIQMMTCRMLGAKGSKWLV